MLKSVALVMSLLANAALAAMLAADESPARSAVTTASRAAAGPPAPASISPQDPAGSYRRLLAAGLGEHEAKALLLVELEAAAVRAIEPPADRYWETPRQAYADYALAVAAAHAVVRASLDAVFADAAAAAPEFARIYRPVDVLFPFLSPEQQVALHSWRLERQRDLLSAGPADPRSGAGERRGAQAPGDELAGLRGVLPADAAFEVALRESSLAEDLRAAGIAYTEDEFRSAYALLMEIDGATGDTRVQIAGRRALRALLGTQRYERIWARRDPVMNVVRRIGRDLALSDAAVAAAYGVLNDAQEQLLELALDGQPGEQSSAAAQRIAAAESDRLAGLLGEQAARALLAARAEYFFAASRAGTREPPARSR
jgi:hypothetical protein